MAADHISFELRCFAAALHQLRSHEGTTDHMSQGLRLEAFLLHARNLLEFLGPPKHDSPRYCDTIFASHFDSTWITREQDPRQQPVKRREQHQLLHKWLAHPTYERLNEGGKQSLWDPIPLAGLILGTFRGFVDHGALPNVMRFWFDGQLCEAELWFDWAMHAPKDHACCEVQHVLWRHMPISPPIGIEDFYKLNEELIRNREALDKGLPSAPRNVAVLASGP